jgi:3' terminal RNA ribose 2'-O-methyltransferase Hen1
MLLTITTTAPDASAIGHLLHKNPASVFRRELSFGEALVFYPEASASKATCALLVKVDPVGLVRGRRGALGLDQFVNDRPFVASSLVAVAISRCFGTAMNGTSKVTDRLTERWPLEVIIPAVACAGGEALIRGLFEPLDYEVTVAGGPLDPRFPDWGPANVFRVELRGAQTIQALLNHLYVLLPALDRRKH